MKFPDINTFESVHPMRFTEASEVIEKLKALPRTGWLQWDIDTPETVYDHICATRMLAGEYQTQLSLSDAQLQDLLDILEIHDWPEALVGDGVILGDEVDVTQRRALKEAREMEAMETICHQPPKGEEVLALYKRYATGADDIARLAKQIENYKVRGTAPPFYVEKISLRCCDKYRIVCPLCRKTRLSPTEYCIPIMYYCITW